MNDQQLIAHARLILNTQVTDLEGCYLEGSEAQQLGAGEDENPHQLGTQEHEYWSEGYSVALYEETPAFGESTASVEKVVSAEEAFSQAAQSLKTWGQRVFECALALVVGLAFYQLVDIVT